MTGAMMTGAMTTGATMTGASPVPVHLPRGLRDVVDGSHRLTGNPLRVCIVKRQRRGQAKLEGHDAGEEEGGEDMHCATATRPELLGKLIWKEGDQRV